MNAAQKKLQPIMPQPDDAKNEFSRQIDINLDLMRQCVQSLLDDCQSVLNRQSIGVSYRHEWEGISLNAVRDIKQRAGVMLRLLDGEVVV